MNFVTLTTNFLALGSICLISTSCGLTESISKGHCMESTDGYEVCIKSSGVDCETDSVGDVKCSAFGRISSLSGGEDEHWSTSKESLSNDSDHIWCKLQNGTEYRNENSYTCDAAKHFNKI